MKTIAVVLNCAIFGFCGYLLGSKPAPVVDTQVAINYAVYKALTE